MQHGYRVRDRRWRDRDFPDAVPEQPDAVPEQLVDRDSADHDLLLLLPRHVEKLDRLVGPFGESKEVARVETNHEDARSLSRRSR
jgi:hypothetical protein